MAAAGVARSALLNARQADIRAEPVLQIRAFPLAAEPSTPHLGFAVFGPLTTYELPKLPPVAPRRPTSPDNCIDSHSAADSP